MDEQIVYRAIEAKDNAALAQIIRDIFEEFEVPKTGTAYADPGIDDMHAAFSGPRARYIVAYEHDRLLGGAGIAPLPGGEREVCELQKMYIQPEARHKGLGRRLLELCLKSAKEMGYSQCYLETMTNMKKAQAMYLRYGFSHIDNRLGDTGHYACPVWMLKDL